MTGASADSATSGSARAARLIGLRVDVDTHEGMRDGVPQLLEIFDQAGVRATFYFSMGPDNSGQAIFNVFKPGFLGKMMRTGAPNLYGWRTVLSGTLLPARPIGTAFPQLIREAAAKGHEVGVHAWNHRKWQDRIDRLSTNALASELEQGRAAFAQACCSPSTFAAPAWITRNEALDAQDRFGLRFASDCRGHEPFLPSLGHRSLSTPQVPATLPTLDERLTRGQDQEAVAEVLMEILDEAETQDYPVFTLHAETEGGPYGDAFRTFLERGAERGHSFGTLGDVLTLRLSRGGLPICPVERTTLPGRHGEVSSQGTALPLERGSA